MNWEAISAGAEMVGSAGVIITLIYLVIDQSEYQCPS